MVMGYPAASPRRGARREVKSMHAIGDRISGRELGRQWSRSFRDDGENFSAPIFFDRFRIGLFSEIGIGGHAVDDDAGDRDVSAAKSTQS